MGADFIFMDLDKPMYAGCYTLIMENGLLARCATVCWRSRRRRAIRSGAGVTYLFLIFGVLFQCVLVSYISNRFFIGLTECFLWISVAPIPKWDQHSLLLLGAALFCARPELDARQLRSNTNHDISKSSNTSVSFIGRSTGRKHSALYKRLGDLSPCASRTSALRRQNKGIFCA